MSNQLSPNDAEHQAILTERRGTTWVVTINRPEVRNAIDGPTAAGLAEAMRTFDRDASLAVAVLTGSGGTFCAGFDLKAVAEGTEGTRTVQVSEEGDGPL